MPLEGIDNIHGGDGLSLGMLGVGDRIANHILQEHLKHHIIPSSVSENKSHLENTSGLFIDQPRDAFDSAPPGQTPDGRLGDALEKQEDATAVQC